MRRFLDEREARDASSWVYEPPYDMYNGDPEAYEAFLAIDNKGYGYYALAAGSELIAGFCCFGPEARVPGQSEQAGTLDIGIGLRPTLTGAGLGGRVLPTILDFGAAGWRPVHLRVAVADLNERSLRLFRSAGFEPRGRQPTDRGFSFIELMRPAP